MWLIYILFVIIILLALELHFRFGRSGRLIRKIPGPKALPIIGNMMSYFLPPEKLFQYQRGLRKIYGDVNQVHGLNVHMVHITSPEDFEKLLNVSQGSHKILPYNFLMDWLNEGLLLSNGPKWLQRRKMLTKAFHFNILQNFFEAFVEEADNLVKLVQEESGKDRTNLFPLMSSTTLRIMCASTMGTNDMDLQSVSHKYLKAMEIIGECFTKRLRAVWLHMQPIFQLTSIATTQNAAVESLHDLTDSVIKNRRDYLAKRNFNHFDHDDSYQSNEKLAMLDLLLKHEKTGLIDHQGIREEVDTFMFAGHDTTAIALTFFIMALANEPEIQDKVYEEICQVIGDGPLTTDGLNQMKYLECCIKESLRLYPSVPIITRHLLKEIVLGGYTVPANATAFIFIYDMHRRADLFPEPERFIPERFLPENSAKRHPYAYIPFSAGPRNCIGQKFAMMELKTLMIKLLMKYRLQPVTRPEDIVFKSDMVMRTSHPIYAKFCKR